MFEKEELNHPLPIRAEINNAYRMPESHIVEKLLALAMLSEEKTVAVENRATNLVELVRKNAKNRGLGGQTKILQVCLSYYDSCPKYVLSTNSALVLQFGTDHGSVPRR